MHTTSINHEVFISEDQNYVLQQIFPEENFHRNFMILSELCLQTYSAISDYSKKDYLNSDETDHAYQSIARLILLLHSIIPAMDSTLIQTYINEAIEYDSTLLTNP